MILSICLIVIAAFAKAVMDRSAEGKPFVWGGKSSYWSKDESWMNKWKHPYPYSDDGVRRVYEERFPGSSTVFVFLTDAWHLFQAIFLTAIFLLVVSYEVTYSWWLDFICIRVLFGVCFESFYRWCVR